MKPFSTVLVLGALLLTASVAHAQTKPAAKPAPKPAAKAPAAKPAAAAAKPAVKPVAAAKPAAAAATKPATVAEAPAPPSLISDKLTPAAPNSTTLKLRLESNPITKRMQVRTNATGPTRVEVNDEAGRPVVTRDLVSGDEVAIIDYSNLPAGYYIIKCTSGERTGMKRVMMGQ